MTLVHARRQTRCLDRPHRRPISTASLNARPCWHRQDKARLECKSHRHGTTRCRDCILTLMHSYEGRRRLGAARSRTAANRLETQNTVVKFKRAAGRGGVEHRRGAGRQRRRGGEGTVSTAGKTCILSSPARPVSDIPLKQKEARLVDPAIGCVRKRAEKGNISVVSTNQS